MSIERRGQAKVLALALVAGLAGATPAPAGILDSVGSFFSGAVDKVKGLFGGGGAKASQSSELEEFLGQIEASQQRVFDLQTSIVETYNAASNGIDATDPAIQGKLDELADATRQNEDLYLQLLKVRAELVEAEADVSAYEDRLGAIQENQKRIEEGYQEIQNFNKDSGLFTPPPQAEPGAGNTLASATAPTTFADLTQDPRVQGFIDEWLASQGLDEYGRDLNPSASVTVRANYEPDMDGRTRHRYVWEAYWQASVDGGQRLVDYVMARLDGQAPAPPSSGGGSVEDPPMELLPGVFSGVSASEPTDWQPVETADASGVTESGTGSAEALRAEGGPAAPVGGMDLAQVSAQYNQARQELTELQNAGEGASARARELLERIRELDSRRNELIRAGQR